MTDTAKNKSNFKSSLLRAVLSIILFIVVYLVLAAIAVGITILCIMGGVALLSTGFSTFGILGGLGLIGAGLMIFIFMVKFMFQANETDRSRMMEIYAYEEPELFEFIRQIAADTHARFPKRIYVTPDVNAAVFYDSSFWSMFLPVRKNLNIGLGLVNSVSKSELRSILAHEFGHFSQKSMMVGSYVYNVNHIIHDMLYNNTSYFNVARKWASIHGVFAFFATVSARIIEGMQYVLQQVHKVIMLSYLGLSREMEFQADAIAASAGGAEPLITSLLRLELAESSYQSMLHFYNSLIPMNMRADNMYPQHASVMVYHAGIYEMETLQGLPVVTRQAYSRLQSTRIHIYQQWTSHPTIEERIDRLAGMKSTVVPAEDESAWALFADPEDIQRALTDLLFNPVEYPGGQPSRLAVEAFNDMYFSGLRSYTFDKRYRGYYDDRAIPLEFQDSISTEGADAFGNWNDLFSDAHLQLIQDIKCNTQDIEILGKINDGTIKVKTFDHNGKKYAQHESFALMNALKQEQAAKETLLKKVDRGIIAYFCKLAASQGEGERLNAMYQNYYSIIRKGEEDMKILSNISSAMRFMTETTPYDQIEVYMKALKEHEAVLVKRLREMMEDEKYNVYWDDSQKDQLRNYLAEDRAYFRRPAYNNPAIQVFRNALNLFGQASEQAAFAAKKELLDYQVSLADKEEMAA